MPRLLSTLSMLLVLYTIGAGQTLRVYHIEVDQGSAALIIGPTGTTCLVDSGPPGQGAASVVPLLASLGISFLDYTVVTHYHNDHWAGFPEIVAAGVGVGVAYDRGTVNQPGGLSSYLNAVGTARTTIGPGTVIDLGGTATVTCVVVNGQVLGGAFANPASGGQEENARSIGLKVSYGGFDEAICGDLGGGGNGASDVETVAAPAMDDVDVMVLSHHGSNTSTNQAWVDNLDAEVGVVSCGNNNPFGHPHTEPLQRFLGSPNAVALYRLNTGSSNPGGALVNGTLLIETDGNSYTASGGQIPSLTMNVDFGGLIPGPGNPPLLPGDVIVSEYMNNPAVVPDSSGEWLELCNTTATTLNLLGFVIRDQGADSFTLPSLTIPTRGRLVLAVNGNSSQNGGVVADFVWPSGAFFIANGSDEIEVVDATGQVLDSVVYDNGLTFPDPTGDSVERVDLKALPYGPNFAEATTSFGAGDNGTPGYTNSVDATGPWISLTAGGNFGIGTSATLTINAAFSLGGAAYGLSMSECGAPGIELVPSGRVVDLCPTPLFNLVAQNPDIPGLISGFQGSLNIFGFSTATINVPPDPSFIGSTFFLSGVVFDSGAPNGMWLIDNVLAVVN